MIEIQITALDVRTASDYTDNSNCALAKAVQRILGVSSETVSVNAHSVIIKHTYYLINNKDHSDNKLTPILYFYSDFTEDLNAANLPGVSNDTVLREFVLIPE